MLKEKEETRCVLSLNKGALPVVSAKIWELTGQLLPCLYASPGSGLTDTPRVRLQSP